MAQILDISAQTMGSLVGASSTEGHVTLDTNRSYAVHHTGLDSTGSAATGTVFMSAAASITATMAQANNKLALLSATVIVLPPGLKEVYLKTAADSPMVNFVLSEHWRGRF